MSESLKAAVQAAVLRILEPLVVWLLEAGIGVGDLQPLIKTAYVRIARERIREAGGEYSKPNASRISIVTGLTRRDVASILATDESRPTHDRGRQRVERVLSGWWNDAVFQDPSGQVKWQCSRLTSRVDVSGIRVREGECVTDIGPLLRQRLVWRALRKAPARLCSLPLNGFRCATTERQQADEALQRQSDDRVKRSSRTARGLSWHHPDLTRLLRRGFIRGKRSAWLGVTALLLGGGSWNTKKPTAEFPRIGPTQFPELRTS
jgi:hypothetical protein